MKKSTFYIVGGFLILLGIVMFVFGVSMFTYQGNGISPFVSKVGMYSFLYCTYDRCWNSYCNYWKSSIKEECIKETSEAKVPPTGGDLEGANTGGLWKLI
jgi:uncharacterized membrane protein YkgB